MMTLNYTFEEQSGPSYYSEQTDEEFYDTQDYDWDYEISDRQIAEFFLAQFGSKENTLEENCKAVAEEVMEEDDKKELLASYSASNLLEVVEEVKKQILRYNLQVTEKGYSNKVKPVDGPTILDYMLDLYHYADSYEDELKDHFYTEAHEDFLENYDN